MNECIILDIHFNGLDILVVLRFDGLCGMRGHNRCRCLQTIMQEELADLGQPLTTIGPARPKRPGLENLRAVEKY